MTNVLQQTAKRIQAEHSERALPVYTYSQPLEHTDTLDVIATLPTGEAVYLVDGERDPSTPAGYHAVCLELVAVDAGDNILASRTAPASTAGLAATPRGGYTPTIVPREVIGYARRAAFDRVWYAPTNQPGHPSPMRGRIDAKSIAGALGWREDGDPVQQIVSHLRAGRGVEAFTRQPPREKGTTGIAYTFLPFAAGQLPDGQMPRVSEVVKLAR